MSLVVDILSGAQRLADQIDKTASRYYFSGTLTPSELKLIREKCAQFLSDITDIVEDTRPIVDDLNDDMTLRYLLRTSDVEGVLNGLTT